MVQEDTGYTGSKGGYKIYWRYTRIQDKLVVQEDTGNTVGTARRIQDKLEVQEDTGYTGGTGGYRIYWKYWRI